MTEMKPASALEDHLGYWLRFVSNHVSHAFSLKLRAEGATVAEWVALRELYAGGRVAPSALAERMGMTRGAISKLADRLADKGLLGKSAGGVDRRYQALALTRAGRALVPKLAALADRNDDEFFGHLAPTERARIARAMREIVRRHELKTIPIE
jgi:DNA-binding MarR family transcriptional regulator